MSTHPEFPPCSVPKRPLRIPDGNNASRTLSGLATALLSTLLAMLSACSDPASTTRAATGLHVQDAYIKRAVPGQKMTAAYATLINYTPDRLCFVGFEADFASSVELHVTEQVGGANSQRVTMRRIREQCLDPAERVSFEPGAKHLMLMGLSDNALPEDQSQVTLRLGTRSGRLFAAEFAVVPFNYSPQNL